MISAFEVAQFVSDAQSWRELADTRKFPLPPELEPECELDVRPNPHVREPTLILVEFDQIVGQNILLTHPTLTAAAVSQLNDSLQVVFGVNYQEVAMSQFCIVPESISIFPDIEYPTYARYFTVYDVDGRGLVRNCCVCFLASTADQLYKYLECMEAQLDRLLTRLTDANLCLFWRALHTRKRSLEYTKDQLISYRQSPEKFAGCLTPEDARTLGMTDCESLDSGIAGVRGAIQVVRDFAAAAAADRSLGLELDAAADLSEPKLVKIMSIQASDAKREMKPIWRLLGQDRESLTRLMAEAIKEAVRLSDDDSWAWCLPSLLGELLEQQLILAGGGMSTRAASLTSGCCGGGDRSGTGGCSGGPPSRARSRVGSLTSSTCGAGGGGGGGAPSVDSFKSCRDDGSGAAAAGAGAGILQAGAEEFHSIGSASNCSSLERICLTSRQCSWTVSNGCGVDDAGCSIQELLAQVPPVFPNVCLDPTPVIRFVSAHSQYPHGVSQAAHCLLQGGRVALLCRTESEARLLQQALMLFVPFGSDPAAWSSGPWFQKLPVLSALASVPVACVRRSPTGQLPASAPLQRLLCCLDVGSRLYSGPVCQGGVLQPLLGADVGRCLLRSQEFAVRLVDLIQTELAQLTLTVMSLHLLKYQQKGGQRTGSSIGAFELPRQPQAAELAKLGISQEDYLIGMHLSKLILGRLGPSGSAQSLNLS